VRLLLNLLDDRTEKLLPNETSPITLVLQALPTRTRPVTDMELPKRVNARSDIEDPRLEKVTTEHRVEAYMFLRTENDDPITNWSKSESLLPTLAKLRKLSELPQTARSRMLMRCEHLEADLNEKLLPISH
jgi:hypothetical protein